MTNRCLLGAGVALVVAFGGVQAHAQLFPPGAPGARYIGPVGIDITRFVHRPQRWDLYHPGVECDAEYQ